MRLGLRKVTSLDLTTEDIMNWLFSALFLAAAAAAAAGQDQPPDQPRETLPISPERELFLLSWAADMSTELLCSCLRETMVDGVFIGLRIGPGFWPKLKAVAAKRRLRFDEGRLQKETLRVGDTVCHMIAVFGMPNEQHRSSSARGTTTQYVYDDGRYVYTSNGIVTGWQD